MADPCKNCGVVITENYCTHCGQKKYKRIDRKYIFDELQYTFLHANKGLLYSVKNIIKNPGKTARDYIDGNRVNHYKPILLLFVLAGISTFISFKILALDQVMETMGGGEKGKQEFMSKFMTVYKNYATFFMALFIPLFAITTKIAFRKWGHNYYEHIVINAYFLTYYTLITIVFIYPISFLLKFVSINLVLKFQAITLILVPFLLVWFFKGFYTDKPLKNIIYKVLGTMGLVLLGYILFIIVVTIIFFIYAMVNGGGALEQFKPK